jgi:hypothetical protein
MGSGAGGAIGAASAARASAVEPPFADAASGSGSGVALAAIIAAASVASGQCGSADGGALRGLRKASPWSAARSRVLRVALAAGAALAIA